MLKRRGRSRANVQLTIPGSVFVLLRSVGLPAQAITDATGVSRSTVTRLCAGESDVLNLSLDEFARLQAFIAVKMAAAEEAVATLAASKPQFELFEP